MTEKIISLYCGAGGIDEGIKQAGFKTAIAIDFDKDACDTFKLNHPDTEVICGKVGDYVHCLPEKVFAVVGGPPCPEFSRANTGRSFDMCEVNNFWQVVENCKPEHFLMENVQDVKKKLWKGSYLLDAVDYGVPQHRLRRFFTDLPLPRPTHAEKPSLTLDCVVLQPWVTVGQALGISGIIEDRKAVFDEADWRKYSTDRPSITIHTDSRMWLVQEIRDKNPVIFDKHLPHYINEPAHTIAAKDYGFAKGESVSDGKYMRKITNEELAILQGFPKTYKWSGPKGAVRRQIGNAVPPPVALAFFKNLKTTNPEE